MNTFKHLKINNFSVLLFFVIFISTPPVFAEQLLKSNGFAIHYNAFNSAMLSPEVAKQYGIQRSSSQGVVNISILKEDTAVTGYLDGQTQNQLSQSRALKFKKITEGNAIYYIAVFRFADREQLSFDITVVPKGETKASKVKFSQQFFVG